MELQGAATPGLLVLTTGLSKPFRRLDKYSAMLQELERHMESGHSDRGDTQRSVAIYKDIAVSFIKMAQVNEKKLNCVGYFLGELCSYTKTKGIRITSINWSCSGMARRGINDFR